MPKYEAPKYEAPKYVAPKYEAPKYVAPKYEAPKYVAPKYEAPKYEAPKYVAPKYTPTYDAPKYEPIWSAPSYQYELPEVKSYEPVYEAAPYSNTWRDSIEKYRPSKPEPVYEEPCGYEHKYYDLGYDYLKKSGKTVQYAAAKKTAYEVPLYIEEFDCGRGGCIADKDEVEDCDGHYDEYTNEYAEPVAAPVEHVVEEDEPSLLERALSYAHGLKFAGCTHREPASHSRAHLAGHNTHFVNPQYSRARGHGGVSQVQDAPVDYGYESYGGYGGYTGYGSYGLGYGHGYKSEQVYGQEPEH
jgi:hypothetical protein